MGFFQQLKDEFSDGTDGIAASDSEEVGASDPDGFGIDPIVEELLNEEAAAQEQERDLLKLDETSFEQESDFDEEFDEDEKDEMTESDMEESIEDIDSVQEPVEEETQGDAADALLMTESLDAKAIESMDEFEKENEIMEENELEYGLEDLDEEALDETAVLTQGMTITGDIKTAGSLDLAGRVIGNVRAAGKMVVTGSIEGNSTAAEIFADNASIRGNLTSSGTVKIGQSSVIIGNITASSAAIAGAVKGDLDIQGAIILDATSVVMGNIKSKSVQINSGAIIEGTCSQIYAEVSPSAFFEELDAK